MRRALAVALLVAVGCSSTPGSQSGPLTVVPGMKLSSPDIEGSAIPVAFTCQGTNRQPAIEWSGVPANTVEVAIAVRDPDVPSGEFLHWAIWGLDPASGAVPADTVPPGAHQARNDASTTGWQGPCPPSGTHHYVFTLYALSSHLNLTDGIDGERFLRGVMAHGIGTASFTATYAHS